MINMYLNVENWEDNDVKLVEMDNKLWVACYCNSNFEVSYVNAEQLYNELKKYFTNLSQNKKD